MTDTKILGVIALLFAVFIFGIIVGASPLQLAILLVVGGLVFLAATVKENVAIVGFIVLIFALLFYLINPLQPIASFTIENPESYFSTLIVMGIVILALYMAFRSTGGK
jgi:hypothetical protein